MSNNGLKKLASQCMLCNECDLAKLRTNVVFGAGDSNAKIMFIGEAPGKNEDMCGEPFVGSAGKLLNDMLESIGLTRDDIYIANILKCRPPKNRDPKPEEVKLCTLWLKEQINLVKPQVLVTLGNFATRYILQTKEGITCLCGKVHFIDGMKVVPMFHPAATIYDRSKADILKSDFKMLAGLLHE